MDTIVELVKGLQKEKQQRRQVVHPHVSLSGAGKPREIEILPNVSFGLNDINSQGDYTRLVEELGEGVTPCS